MRPIAFVMYTRSFQVVSKNVSMRLAFQTGDEIYIYRGDPSGRNGKLIPYSSPRHEPKYGSLEDVPEDFEILSLSLTYRPDRGTEEI